MSFSVTPIGIILIMGFIALLYKDFFREKHLAVANGASFVFKDCLKKFYIDNFICFVCLTFLTNLGYIVKVNSFEVGLFTPFYTIIWVLSLYFLIAEKKFDKKIIIVGSIIAVIDIIAVVLCVVFPYKNGIITENRLWDLYLAGEDVKTYSFSFGSIHIKYLFTLFKFTITLATVNYIIKDEDIWFKLLEIIVKMSYFVVAYGFIEMIALKLFNFSTTNSIINFLFSVKPVTDYVSQGRFQGLYKEPSHYCLNLFFISLFVILYLIKNKNTMQVKNGILIGVLLALVLLLMALSKAFSAVILIPLSVFVFVWYFFSSKQKLSLILAIIVLTALIFSLIMNKTVATAIGFESLNEKINGVFDSIGKILSGREAAFSSEGSRFTSMFESVKLLFYRPWGVGLGNTDAHSSFFSLFACLGIVGAPLHIYIILRSGHFSQKSLIFGFVILISILFIGGIGYFTSIVYPVLFFMGYLIFPEPKVKKKKVELYEKE
ncbi:MAG: hypothetical protein VZQ61_00075 [Christensenellaceae bacterium]